MDSGIKWTARRLALTRQAACFCSPSNSSQASTQVCLTSFGVRYHDRPHLGIDYRLLDVPQQQSVGMPPGSARTAVSGGSTPAGYVAHYHDRPHSGIDYRTPKEVRQTWVDAREEFGGLQKQAA